jgi:hypothetical protein
MRGGAARGRETVAARRVSKTAEGEDGLPPPARAS